MFRKLRITHNTGILIITAMVLLVSGCLSKPVSQERLLTNPYLQSITDSAVCVMVETSGANPAIVHWWTAGTDTMVTSSDGYKQTSEGTYVQRIWLRPLKPMVEYQYRIEYEDTSTPMHHFHSYVPSGTPVRFGWMADCRTNVGIHDSISTHLKMEHPDLLLYGGDICGGSSYKAFKTEFFRPAEMSLIEETPFVNATGNHENWGKNTQAFTQAPYRAPHADQGYYSFDTGDLHVVVLDNEVAYHAESEQFAFVQQDLKSTKQPWKIVISHKPAYCGGGHGEDTDMKDLTSLVFEKTGVAMVISGHTHFYQHNIVHGIHHLVIGSAGAPLYTPEPKPYTVKSAKEYEYAIGEVTPTKFRLDVRDEHGGLIETIELKKSSDR